MVLVSKITHAKKLRIICANTRHYSLKNFSKSLEWTFFVSMNLKKPVFCCKRPLKFVAKFVITQNNLLLITIIGHHISQRVFDTRFENHYCLKTTSCLSEKAFLSSFKNYLCYKDKKYLLQISFITLDKKLGTVCCKNHYILDVNIWWSMHSSVIGSCESKNIRLKNHAFLVTKGLWYSLQNSSLAKLLTCRRKSLPLRILKIFNYSF